VAIPDGMPRALRCRSCGRLARHFPFVKPASDGFGLVCSRCGLVTPPPVVRP
jgi:hypothetical protein